MRVSRRRAVFAVVMAAGGVAAVLALPRGEAAFVVAVLVAVAAVAPRLRRERRAGGEPGGASAPAGPPREALEALLDALSEAVLVVDEAFLVVAANEAAGRLFARRREAMRSLSLIRVVRDHHLLQLAREATGDPVELQLEGGRPVRAVAARLDSPLGAVALAVEDLYELRAAQRARTELVANVSHELRTPVAAALALAETLEGGVPDEAQRAKFMQRLTSELERLGAIVERLLYLSRLESASERFEVEPVEPAELLATAAGRIEPLLRDGRRVVVRASPAPPVAADRERALEVLGNLLDNARRYTPPGGAVTLSAAAEDGEVRFEVQDEGPGILPHERARVFERFYTGERARTAEAGERQTGLGLAIARHIVTRLGGRIWVGDSERGARLCFTLPAASPDGAADGAADETSGGTAGAEAGGQDGDAA